MKNHFLASWNQFLPFSRTAVNCCQWKQFFLQLEYSFLTNLSLRLVETSFSDSFFCREQYFFIPSFFLLVETIIEIWGKSNFKEESISASGHYFFSILSRDFFKWKQFFRMMERYFQYPSSGFFFFFLLEGTDFLASGNHFFIVFPRLRVFFRLV